MSENGATDPALLEYMRQEAAQAGRVGGAAALLPLDEARVRNIGLPIGPNDPGYRKRIPPGAPDPVEPTAISALVLPGNAQAAGNMTQTPIAASPQQRVVVSFGPQPGQVIVGVETAPDWDMEESFQVSASALREMLPILKALTKLKDLTGGAFLRSADESA